MIPLNLVLSSIILITVIFSLILAFYSFIRRSTDTSALPLFFLLSFSSIYMYGYIFTIQQHNIENIVRCLYFKYFGVAFIPACFVFLAVSISPSGGKFFSCLTPAAFVLSSLILLSVLTNDYHHLYFSAITMDSSGPFPSAVIVPGPLSAVKNVYYMVAMIFAVGQYVRRIRKTGGIDRDRMVLFIGAFVLGIISQIVLFSGIVPWHIDSTPFFLLPINALMTYGILKKDLFDVSSIAWKQVVAATKDGILVVLPDRTILDWNPAIQRFFPDADENLSGKNLDFLSAELGRLCRNISGCSAGELEILSDGETRHISIDVILLSEMSKKKKAFALILRDISESKRNIALLEELAIHDSLTGCFVRRHWLTLAETELLRSKRNGQQLSVIMIDIDHFKNVNDTWGHAMGDSVLKNVTKTFLSELRATDSLGRLGGEEFYILLPETGLYTAVATAERLRESIEKMDCHPNSSSVSVPITISLGVTCSSHADPSMNEVLLRADDAMYRAKKNGRNRVDLNFSPVPVYI